MLFSSQDRPLIDELMEDNAEGVADSVKFGSDPNAVGYEGVTPAMYAIHQGKYAAFAELLENGADVNAQDSLGRSVMSMSAALEDSRFLKAAIASGGDVNLVNNTSRHTPGDTPIFNAIKAKRPENVQILIDAGADIEVTNGSGRKPLHVASSFLALGCAIKLVDAGADPYSGAGYGTNLSERVDELMTESEGSRKLSLGEEEVHFQQLLKMLNKQRESENQ